MPSHNKSNTFSALSLDLYVDVIKEFVKFLKPDRIIIGGHSMGGVIAQEFYFNYPEDITALILCSTGGKMRVSSHILNTVKNNYQQYLDELREGSFYRKTPKNIIDNAIFEISKAGSEVTYNDFKICDAFDTLAKTSTIDVPCLIICGKADQMTPVKYSQFFHNKIINSQLCIIEKAGHSVMIEQPKKVNKIIENFTNTESFIDDYSGKSK